MPTVSTGVAFRPTTPPERLRDVVASAEKAGADELWLWEDCFAQGGLTSAAAALAWSEHLVIGVGLLPAGLRNAGLVAMEIATLARMFPNRFLAGLGHGAPAQLRSSGVDIASPMTLLREQTAAVRSLLHGHRVDVDGQYTTLDAAELEWPPLPAPPVLIGARGPRTLRLAGELTDGVILDSIAAPGDLPAALAEIDAGRAIGGRQGPFRVVVYVEPPPDLSAVELIDVMAGWVRDLGQAGATSVIFVPGPQEPDPLALLAALATSRQP